MHPKPVSHKTIWLHLIHIQTDRSDDIYLDVPGSKSDLKPKQRFQVISQDKSVQATVVSGLQMTDFTCKVMTLDSSILWEDWRKYGALKTDEGIFSLMVWMQGFVNCQLVYLLTINKSIFQNKVHTLNANAHNVYRAFKKYKQQCIKNNTKLEQK